MIEIDGIVLGHTVLVIPCSLRSLSIAPPSSHVLA